MASESERPEPSRSEPNFVSLTSLDEHEPTLRERLLNLSTMEVHFRTLTVLVVTQIIATSLLVLLSDHSFGDITLKIGGGFGQATVGVTNYIAAVAFLLIGLTLFVAGLGRADLRGMATLLAFFFILYLFDLILAWLPLELWLTILVTIFVLFFASMMAAIFVRRGIQAKMKTKTSRNPIVLLVFIFVPWVGAGLYALVSQPAFFYTVQFVVGIPFIVLYPFAAIDWAEIADSSIKRLQQRLHLQQRSGLFLFFGSISAALPIWLTGYAFTHAATAVGYELLVVCALTAALCLLLRLAHFRGDWPAHFPWAPTAALVGVSVFLFQGVGRYLDPGLLTLVFAAAMSVLLCVCGRNPQWQSLAPTALFGTLIGFTLIYLMLFSTAVSDLIALVILGATTASLYTAIQAVLTIARSRSRRDGLISLRYPLQALLTLNVSLVAIYVLTLAYGLMLASSDRHVVEAFVIAVALLSELLLSGHSVTNIQSDWFPRNSRLLMFFGFVTFTLAYTLSIVALRGETEQLKAFKLFLNPETAVLNGLVVMAPALLWTLFILRIGRWLAQGRIIAGVNAPAAAGIT